MLVVNKMVLFPYIALVACVLGSSIASQMELLRCTSEQDSSCKFSIVRSCDRCGCSVTEIKGGDYGNDCNGGTEGGKAATIQLASTMTSTPCERVCKDPRSDYELIRGLGYYKMHITPKNWFDALQTCAQEGAHLLIVSSQAEARGLIPFLAKRPRNFGDYRDTWSFGGFHDYFAEGKFITIFSQLLSNSAYNVWNKSQPDGGTGESCGVVDDNATLGDAPCGHDLVFACEQELCD